MTINKIINSLIIVLVLMFQNVTASEKTNVKVELTKNRWNQPTITIYLKNDQDMLLGTASSSYVVSNKSAHLAQIGVISEYQDRGYGTILWDNMIKELKKLGIKKIDFTAVPGGINSMDPEWESKLKKLVDWYQKRGAKIIKWEDKTPFMEFEF